MSRVEYLNRRYRGTQSLVNRRELRYVEALLAELPRPLDAVLDLPSGHGRFTPVLRAAASRRLVCADHNPANLAALREAEPAAGTSLETTDCDLYQPLPFADGEFDLVFNFRFFHHIEQDEQRRLVVTELARVAKRYLIVSYYHPAHLHAWQKRLWRRSGHKRRLPMVARETFRALFAAEGCEIVHDRAVVPGIHAQRIALLAKR